MKEIARAADVSVSAVSLALRNKRKISESERTRIQRIAASLGYKPDPVINRYMSYLRANPSRVSPAPLAFVVPGYPRNTDRKIAEMMRGATAQAERHGYRMAEFWPQSPPVLSPAALRRVLRTRGVEGLLFGPMRRGDDHSTFDFSSFSVAALGYSMRTPDVHRAVPNHYRALRTVLQELAGRGFRRIGMVLWERMETGFNRLLSAAYYQYQHDLPAEDRLPTINPRGDRADRIDAAEVKHWYLECRPDVILGPGAVCRLLAQTGVRVPDEVSFVSLDLGDLPHDAAGLLERHDLVGAAAVDLLVSQLNLGQRGVPLEPKIVMVPSTWRDGATLSQVPSPHRRRAPRRS